MSLFIPFPFWGLLNKKTARVEVNISLAFLHWVPIPFYPWPFVSDIAIFVLKREVKLQLTSYRVMCTVGIYGGFLLGVRSVSGLAFYDWETNSLVRRIEITPRMVRNWLAARCSI